MLRLRLDDAECRRYRFAVRRPAGLLEETPLQPAPEALRFDRPRLPMPIDLDIGVGDLVGRLKEVGRLGQRNQNVGMGRRTAIPPLAGRLGNQTVKLSHPAAGLLQPRPQRLELNAVGALERSNFAHGVRSERRARVLRRRRDQGVTGGTPFGQRGFSFFCVICVRTVRIGRIGRSRLGVRSRFVPLVNHCALLRIPSGARGACERGNCAPTAQSLKGRAGAPYRSRSNGRRAHRDCATARQRGGPAWHAPP